MTNRAFFATCLAILLPAGAAAQFLEGPKPIPRPEGPYSIGGRIVNGMTGMPVAGAEISISTGAQGIGRAFEIAESGADGNFRFIHLAEGKYTLKAERRGYASQALLQHENYWSGVAVGPGKDAQHVRFALYPSAVVFGRVTDENGEGARGATVKLWKRVLDNGKPSIEIQTQALTDDRGVYRFDHLPAGKYAVSVRATPWYSKGGAGGQVRRVVEVDDAVTTVFDEQEPAPEGLPDVVYPRIYYPRGSDLSTASWFELQPGEEESADFQLTPRPGIRLVLRINDGDGKWAPIIEEAEGSQDEWDGPGSSGTVISPGVVEFSGLTPGKYRVNVPRDGSADRENEDVEISTDSEFDFRASAPAESKWSAEVQLSGNPRGEPWGALQLRDEARRMYDARVPISGERPESSGEAAPAEQKDNSLLFQHVPPGKGVYEVDLTLPIGGTIESLQATGATVSGHWITTEGGDVHLKVRGFVSQISLQGTAKKNGQPFAGAMMLLLPETGGPQLIRRDQSDSDGTFTLPNVVPGKYKLLALENGWEMPWADPDQRKSLLAKGMAIEIGRGAPAAVTVEVQ